MKQFLLLALLLATPIAYAADCVRTETETEDGELQDVESNPPKCRDANGRAQGKWEERFADGEVETGDYVDGERHGQWELRWADGDIWVGPYKHGEKHGQWEERVSNIWTKTEYVHGKKKQLHDASDNSLNSLGFINATDGYCSFGYVPSEVYPGKCYKKPKVGDLIKVHSSAYACRSHRDELNLIYGGYQCSGNRLYRNY